MTTGGGAVFNVCPVCGLYSEEKAVAPEGPYAICPNCGHRHPFLRLPLFVVTGASGSGKSTICLALAGRLRECVVLESDILWGVVPASPDDGYRGYANTWLRLVKNIHQSGRPVALFGTATPETLESCAERRYLGPIHYLALVCDDDVLAARLQARPTWREAGSAAFVAEMQTFNRWLFDHAATTQPPMTLLDTGGSTLQHSAAIVARWVRSHLR